MSDDRHEAVRRRAYELWEKEGGGHGRHEDHWHRASREVSEAGASSDVVATADVVNGVALPPAASVSSDTPANAPRKRAPAKAKAESAAVAKPRKTKAK